MNNWFHRTCLFRRSSQRGSVTSEYLVVLLGLLIVWVGIEIVLELIRLHNERYSATLELLF
jgi:hypothetical protein